MKKQKIVNFYELEKIKFLIQDACGLDVSYAYDDLVFAEHGLFIIQFLDQEGKELLCWFNNDIIEENEIKMFDSLVKSATLNASAITYSGRFLLNDKNRSNQIDIQFIPARKKQEA